MKWNPSTHESPLFRSLPNSYAMGWTSFLNTLCQRQSYGLTPLEMEVVMCLKEGQGQTKNDLLAAYARAYSTIEEEAFTQRLKNIYKKFKITGKGHKLPQLHRYLTEQYVQYQNKDIFFSDIGLTYIHPAFPSDSFGKAIDQVIDSDDLQHQKVDILQTFAPNLDNYSDHLIRCLDHRVSVRILLAWPYSQAAKLREEVLRRYANRNVDDNLNIRESVIANLETLEKILRISHHAKYLDIRLYDTLPSLAIYRAGNYMVAAPFLHGALAVDTFQLELTLNTANPTVTQTLQKDFELMWEVARQFYPDPTKNWRNDLKILFSS